MYILLPLSSLWSSCSSQVECGTFKAVTVQLSDQVQRRPLYNIDKENPTVC